MKNKSLLIGLCIILIVVSGCIRSSHYYSNPIYFDDTGNDVDNMKECEKLMRQECARIYDCKYIKITKLECDEGECYCD